MRKLTAVVCLALAGACGGEIEVTTVEPDGTTRTTNISPEELKKHRSGELRIHALVTGSGNFADCNTDTNTYPGESTLRSGFSLTGDCRVMWANDTSGGQGYGAYGIGFNETWTTWQSTGIGMNNTIRSSRHAATNLRAMQMAWSHNTMGSGGVFTYRIEAGTSVSWPFYVSGSTCPDGSNCPDGPMQLSGLHGFSYTN